MSYRHSLMALAGLLNWAPRTGATYPEWEVDVGDAGVGGAGGASGQWRGKIGRMSEREVATFCAGNPVAKLGCLDEDGWPYVVPVWFERVDDGYFVISRERSAWARYLQRDGRVGLCIDEVGPPYRKVLVKGTARILEEPNLGGRWVEIARRMSLRYLGEHGPKYLEATLGEPRWLLLVSSVKTTTWQGVDWHPRYKHSASR